MIERVFLGIAAYVLFMIFLGKFASFAAGFNAEESTGGSLSEEELAARYGLHDLVLKQ